LYIEKFIPVDMHVVSVMIWLDVVCSGICSADAVTDNNRGTKEYFRTTADETRHASCMRLER
jgi:hypothetical protein